MHSSAWPDLACDPTILDESCVAESKLVRHKQLIAVGFKGGCKIYWQVPHVTLRVKFCIDVPACTCTAVLTRGMPAVGSLRLHWLYDRYEAMLAASSFGGRLEA